MAVVVDAIAVGRLDGSAVVDLKRGDLHAIFLVDDTVLIELLRLDRNTRLRQLLVFETDLDVERIGFLQVVHQRLRTGWPDDAKRRGAARIWRRQPAGEPE